MSKAAWTASILLVGVIACARESEPQRPAAPSASADQPAATPAAPAAETLSGTDLKRGDEIALSGFKTLQGTSFDPDSLAGKAALVNVWATWCIPCREEMPDLALLAKSMEGKPFAMVGVSVDDAASKDAVADFVKETKVGYPIVLDPEQKLLASINSPVLPTTILLDRKGKVTAVRLGPLRHDDPRLVAAINEAMR